MSLTVAEMNQRVREWAAAQGVPLPAACEQGFENLFATEVEPRVQQRLASGHAADDVSNEVDDKIDQLLHEIVKNSPIRQFHETATGQALVKLCPGFWPFC